MIPKDWLHCPLRTLSLAGPLLARRSRCFNKQTIPIRNILGPKSFVLSPCATYIQGSVGFLFRKPLLFSIASFAISSLGRSRRRYPPPRSGLHGKETCCCYVICSSFSICFLDSTSFFWIFRRWIGAPRGGSLLVLFLGCVVFCAIKS
jgi:hypothetical protein